MPTHTTLKGVSHVSESLASDQLEANLIGFFQWGFLGVGGFFNVARGQTSCDGGDESLLRPVERPGYPNGQVWEGRRKDWVWESGVEYHTQPVPVSGVYINGSFLPTASGVSIDYPNGRVVLPSPVAPTSVVQCEHSRRLFQLYTVDNPAWQTIQTETFRTDDPQFLQLGSGAWDVLAENRVQLPAVFVQAVPNATRSPKEIGNGSAVVRQSVLFHVLAEERSHYKWLGDTIAAQWQKRLQGFDKNKMLDADAFPLDPYGAPKDGALMYPDLVKPTGEGGFYWEQIRFADTQGTHQPRLGPLWYCTVRATMEVDRPG